MFHVKHSRWTVRYARAKLLRDRLYNERWYPTTYGAPLHDRPYGAVRAGVPIGSQGPAMFHVKHS